MFLISKFHHLFINFYINDIIIQEYLIKQYFNHFKFEDYL